jgi:hypothetical protein
MERGEKRKTGLGRGLPIYVPVLGQCETPPINGSTNASRSPPTHLRRLRLPGSGRDNAPAASSKWSCTPRDGHSISHPGYSHGKEPPRPLADWSPGLPQTKLGRWGELAQEHCSISSSQQARLEALEVGNRAWPILRGGMNTRSRWSYARLIVLYGRLPNSMVATRMGHDLSSIQYLSCPGNHKRRCTAYLPPRAAYRNSGVAWRLRC